jgi:hypothetical protein
MAYVPTNRGEVPWHFNPTPRTRLTSAVRIAIDLLHPFHEHAELNPQQPWIDLLIEELEQGMEEASTPCYALWDTVSDVIAILRGASCLAEDECTMDGAKEFAVYAYFMLLATT